MTRDKITAAMIAFVAILVSFPALGDGVSEVVPLPKMPADFDPEKVLILACLYIIRDSSVKQQKIIEQLISNKPARQTEE